MPRSRASDGDRVAHALATLPDLQRDAIVLRYGAGLTARQIGEVLGKREAATQKLLSRALASLRKQVPMSMTDAVLVERTLAELLQTQPSVDAMRRMDIRIAQAIAARPTVGAARLPRRFGRRRVVLGLLAAAALTMGAGGALGLYDGMGAGMDYGFSIQMARSAAINASAVDDGFRVTIDRAYLDGERAEMLAVRDLRTSGSGPK